MSKWKVGDECYYITSNRIPVKATIKAVQGDFCVLQYGDGKGIRLRQTRLYKSELEAMSVVPKPKKSWHNPYDYEH